MSNWMPGHDQPPVRRRLSWALMITLVVLGMLAGGGTALVVRGASSDTPPGSSDGPLETPNSPGLPEDDPSTAEPTSEPSASSTPRAGSSPDSSPSESSSPDDPPAKDGEDASVVRSSAGSRCTPLDEQSSWGRYPLARCRFWKVADGHLSGRSASKGERKVTCQRDLGVKNPVYAKGQTNTWWVWARSDDGTWDWFPETAVEQGVSNQPINGISLCAAGS